jgi:TonB family protein
MQVRDFILAICALTFFAPVVSHGQAYATLPASAIDAKGVRHRGNDYVSRPPWMNDVLHTVVPEYPASERAQHHKGRALLRLTLDLKTGSVNRAIVIRSSGFAALDTSAVAAFRQWRWRPGRWKEIDVPVRFDFGRWGMSY